MEQTETTMMAEAKPQVDNVVSSHPEIELRIAAHIACITEKMVAKEI